MADPISFNLSAIQAEFPALRQEVAGHRLVYLDNSATTQRPISVLHAMDEFYRHDNANVHRGVHTLSQRATDKFDAARRKVAEFVNAAEDAEIIFTKGCTEAINLVAAAWGSRNLEAGDVVLVTTMEHHANIVPWQLAGARTVPIPIFDDGSVDLDAYQKLLIEHRPKMVALKHVCNVLGTVNPLKQMSDMAHGSGALVLADGAQALAHERVDVRDLGVDFYAMSAHKVYGPMGVGALYGKRAMLEAMPPYQSGGAMIRTVAFEETTFNVIPDRFEPGTPNAAGVVGFGAALEFLNRIGIAEAAAHEKALADETSRELEKLGGIRLVGTAPGKAGIVSFAIDGVHPHDAGTILDQEGVAVRTGHHCCMPLMRRLGLPATVRASFAMYNSNLDAEVLIHALKKVKTIFA